MADKNLDPENFHKDNKYGNDDQDSGNTEDAGKSGTGELPAKDEESYIKALRKGEDKKKNKEQTGENNDDRQDIPQVGSTQDTADTGTQVSSDSIGGVQTTPEDKDK